MKTILALLILLVTLQQTTMAAPSKAQLLAAYIISIVNNVHWTGQSRIDKFQIHVIDDGAGVYENLTKAAKIKNIHNRQFIVSRSYNADIPASANIVFIPKSLSIKYIKVYKKTKDRPILLISNQLNDDRYALIDIEENTSKLKFKINKPNILNRGMRVAPDIIFLGGSEIDVAVLYKKGQTKVQKQNQRLESLNKIIVANKKSSQKLLADLKRSKDKILLLNNTIEKQILNIENKQNIVDELYGKIEIQKTAIKNNSKILKEREKNLAYLHTQIDNGASFLTQQNYNIASQKKIIDRQMAQMVDQTQTIKNQSMDLEKQMFTINTQKEYLYLTAFSFFVSLLLMLSAFYAYQNKKKTNAKLLEYTEHLAKTKEIAENSTKAKSKFLSSMTHELRSPLTSIIGFSELLKDDPSLSTTVKKNINIINRSGAYLLTLINDVLDLSKIESGQIEFHDEITDLSHLLYDVINMFRVHADNKDLKLNIDISPNCPAFIFTDATKLRRILINLMSNAIKHTEVGAVSVRALAFPTSNEKQVRIQVEVEDTGSGIAEDQQELIFKPYKQINPKQTIDWQQGTGLGLNICKQLVELMEGSISVSSSLEKGSIFEFSIIVGAISKKRAAIADSDQTQVIGFEPKRTLNILIAEDLEESALYLTSILKNIGCHITVATNGRQAILAYQKNKPDLIFMDKRMPGIDGIQATRTIRNLEGGEDIAIVAITASSFNEDRDEMMVETSFNDYIRKPYLREEIYNCMEKYLDIKFLYAKTTSQSSSSSSYNYDLVHKSLARLSKTMYSDLRAAILELDVKKTLLVIELIKEEDLALAEGLEELVKKFDFNRLNTITQTI